jgi:hypothetical protein
LENECAYGPSTEDVARNTESHTNPCQKGGPFPSSECGVPGIVRNGVVWGALNLDSAWEHFLS